MWSLLLACVADSPEGEEPPSRDTGITLGDVVACDAPADAPSWTDVAESRGLRPTELTTHTMGGSAAVEDLDGDGDLDIVIDYPGGAAFYLRDGEAYSLAAVPTDVDAKLVSVGDLGAYGLEVIIGSTSIKAYRVVDGAVEARLIFDNDLWVNTMPAQGAYPADIDEDGLIDLYAMQAAPEGVDAIYWGVGGGWFEPDLETLDPDTTGRRGFDAHWFDYDVDGDLDLYVSNDMGPTYGANVLYRNDDGVLVDASDTCSCALSVSAMGADSTDFSGDGYPDLYVSISGDQALLESQGDGSFVDVTRASGIPAMGVTDMGWGAVFVDIENDGDPDIFEARGDLWDDPETGVVFDTTPRVLQNDDLLFSDVAEAEGFAVEGSWRIVVPHDDNGDGVEDFLLTSVNERPVLWVSDSCTANSWLDVRAPIGAEVEIEAGGRVQRRWVTWQSGMGGARPAVVHFGLGEATEIDRITVTDLQGRVWESTEPFPARRVVTVGG